MHKTGHWILDSIVSMDNTNTKTFIYKCSECGFYTNNNRIDACHHCGAKMIGAVEQKGGRVIGGVQMNDLIEKLSNLRSQFNCFNENERDAYHTLSEAIKVLSERPEPCEDMENDENDRSDI